MSSFIFECVMSCAACGQGLNDYEVGVVNLTLPEVFPKQDGKFVLCEDYKIPIDMNFVHEQEERGGRSQIAK